MNKAILEKLKFPIGKFEKPHKIKVNHLEKWIKDIASFPSRIKTITDELSTEEKEWQYRPNGWSIKQVVHHCADSHINSFIRFKLALTEDNPTIKPYNESRWAELIDGQDNDISDSLLLLTALHRKWTKLLQNLTAEELKRTFIHPASNEITSLEENIGIYAWHCNHHLAHIENAIASKGKYRDK